MSSSIPNKPQLTEAILLKDVGAAEVKWVQTQLIVAGYLAKDGVDGAVGDKTLAALAAFKEAFYLEYPAAIGPSTVEILESVEGKHEVEDQPDTLPTTANADAGKKSGKTSTLPNVGLVYENEFVFPDTHITWGEMTRSFTRLPTGTAEFGSPEQVVKNMIELAKVFGVVRTKFGSPLAINSAYRPPTLAIGVSKSQHKFGRGLDVRPLNGDYKVLLEVIRAVPQVKGIGLAGPKKGFWHMDIRPGTRQSFSY
jgi:Peptidase M15/Putative peptidoglycan binding domain